LQEAKELMKALEIYRTKHGMYPCTGTNISCVVDVDNYSLRAYLRRPPTGTYDGTLPAIEPTLRTTLYAPASDPYGYSLMYRTRVTGLGSSQADPLSYTIVVGLENPITTTSANTTSIDVNGNNDPAGTYTMNYCKISVGTLDTESAMGVSGAETDLQAIGNCPIAGIN
jgi:hypothetical protein